MNKITGILILLITSYYSFSQDTWIERDEFPGVGRWYPVGFALESAIFIGLNSGGGDFYKFDLPTNKWSVTSQIPGSGKEGAYSFAFDSIGIIVGGCCYSTEVWKYSPSNDSWTQLNAFPGGLKSYGVSWTYNSFGYICTGWSSDFTESTEFWKYNPANDSWVQLADFPGLKRGFAAGFQIGSKGYLGTGAEGSTYLNDFWEYDIPNSQWKQLSNFPGSARLGMVGFMLGNSGYLGTGNKLSSVPSQDLWRFDPMNQTWVQKSNFPGGPQTIGIGISNGSRAFVGLGLDGSNFPQFFWEYVADTSTSAIIKVKVHSMIDVFPNPTRGVSALTFPTNMVNIKIIDKTGKRIFSSQPGQGVRYLEINMHGYSPGIYFIELTDFDNNSVVKKLIKI